MFYVFYEISDWRNFTFWWIYEILVADDFECTRGVVPAINSLIRYSKEMKTCGLRVLLKEFSKDLLKDTQIENSHYFIFDKIF
jgi:hypothetical protein